MTTTAPAPSAERSAADRSSPAPGTGLQVLGLSLLALAPLTMFAIGAAAGMDVTEGIPFLVIGVVLGVVAFLAARFGTWSKIVGIVLTLLAGFAGFWLAFGLMAPASPGDFLPGLLFVLGIVLSLYGGGRAIANRRRRGTAVDDARRARAVVVGIVVVAAVGSVAANLVARGSVDADAAAAATPVGMAEFAFDPLEVTVAADDGASLLVRNHDAFLHDLTLPEHDLAVTVTPGSEALLDISGLAAGTYTVYCTLHSDTSDPDPESAGMAATLIVE